MEEELGVDIDALIDEFEYIPGYFHLEMNLNFESCTPPHIRRRDIKLKQEALQLQLEFESSSQHSGIKNLLGVFSFYLDEIDRAKETFTNICNQDPSNLNAWANLACVYDKLNMEEEATQCADKISHLMNLDTEGASTEPRLMAARCLAEQGYAHEFDVGQMTENDNMEKLVAGISLYDKALAYGKHKIPIEEKRSWFFTMASLCMRLDEILITKENVEEKRRQFYNKTLMLLREAEKSSNNHYKALSWCYIGMILDKQFTFSDPPMGIHDYGFTGTDPLDCFSKAIEIGKGDPVILNRLAKIFHFLGKQEMATGICNMALSALKDPKLNCQAYCTRAQIFIWMYVRDLERAKLGLGGLPDRNHLSNAKSDLESIIDIYPCLKTYLEMGQVCYYMGVDAVQELMLTDEDSINQALVCIAKATEYDLANTLPELQLLKGKCLRVKGEEMNAMECFKKAMNLQSKGSLATETFRHLIEILLSLYSQTKIDAETLVREVEFWVKEAQEKYDVESVSQELQTVCRNNTMEIVKLSKAMIMAGKMDLVRLLLQSVMVNGRKLRPKLNSRSSSF
ncbi:tetratricopeptide repeat protein 22 [Hyla sarda]|uniref:tetratricopeptide repeat protein 22 n=1 Tax=Hyla sarda TaxID=327740 RepID=UPI0024C26551|nr:tetratricopeptide repeat protein 22 [Hyla sarda]